MLPQHRAKRLHYLLKLRHPQLLLARLTLSNILLDLIDALMDFLMLLQQFFLVLKRWHLSREDGEDVAFFYRVMGCEVAAKLFCCSQVGADAHAAGSFAGACCVVELVPG